MMLFLSTKLSNIPLLSIRTAGRIGTVLKPIINPHNLHIDAFFCQVPRSQKPQVLLDMFVREVSPAGLITNEHDDLSEPEDLVRLQPIIKLNFELIGKTVVSGKKKIGKVAEYAVDKDSLLIQKLYVQPPMWQSLNQSRLTIDRQSVLEVTNTTIKVSGPEEKVGEAKPVKAPLMATDYSASASLIKE
jgi:hypothetical protein